MKASAEYPVEFAKAILKCHLNYLHAPRTKHHLPPFAKEPAPASGNARAPAEPAKIQARL